MLTKPGWLFVQQVGKSLQDSLDVGSAKDVGKAVDRNTPDVDLTQNPKDLAKQGAEAVDRNTPNLGGLFNKVSCRIHLVNLFEPRLGAVTHL